MGIFDVNFTILCISLLINIQCDQKMADALSLHLQVEEVAADGIEFIEFEGDHAYCRYNKCQTEFEKPVVDMQSLSISTAYLVFIQSAHF